MSSLRNAFRKRTYKERSQPESRKKFGFLEKHKDYVIRAKEYHKKEETLRKLREKAANRNPDEFYFGMIRSKSVNGVHRPQSKGNKYKPKEPSLTKTRDGYVLQKLQIEKKNVEKLRATLHDLGDQPSNRKKAKKLLKKCSLNKELNTLGPIPKEIKREVNASYKELKARMKRVEDLERVHAEMTLQKELQKKGRKRKLREDEIVCPTSKPVYKWRAERKR